MFLLSNISSETSVSCGDFLLELDSISFRLLVAEIEKYSLLMFDTNNWPLMSDNVTTRFWPRQDFCSN